MFFIFILNIVALKAMYHGHFYHDAIPVLDILTSASDIDTSWSSTLFKHIF